MADGVKKINEWIMKDGRTINVTRTIDAAKLEGGTQYINAQSGLLQYVNITNTGSKVWKNYDPMVIFLPQSIKTNLIADLNITTAKLADSSVVTSKINNLAIVESKIAVNAVTETKILESSVTTGKINNFAVISDKLASNSVLTTKIKDGAVTSDKIATNTILNGNIADGTIKNEKFFNKTITNAKIADKTIIESLFEKGCVSTRALADKSVTTSKIELRNITRPLIAVKAVSGVEIDDESIETNHVLSLNASKLIDKSIIESKHADQSVSNRVIANKAVSMTKLDENVQDLINRSIRVEVSQTVAGSVVANTAWCKGSLLIQSPSSGTKANLTVKGDITSTGTVTATKCYNPVFADLAEAYVPTEKVESGDPVCLSLEGGLKIEKLTANNQDRFIGFVSDEYATVFGATAEELRFGKKVAVTLVGRIKIKASEEAKIGNYVYIVNGKVKFYPGRGVSAVGRVLENKCETDSFVLCQLWP